MPPLNKRLLLGTLAVYVGTMLALGGDARSRHDHPASDPANAAGWMLNKDMSDEFEGRELDASKWLVQGTDGEYRSQWIGRAPSQFSTNNVRLENGKLKIQTRWEPDFPFSAKPDAEGRKYENITTAAVISKKQFLYGYMEIKCKAANASITSSFWATGHNSELDVFEFIGAPAQAHKKHLEKEYLFTMIDWSKRPSSRVWRGKHDLKWRVADGFHVYGCEWNARLAEVLCRRRPGRKRDGRSELGDRWVLKYPLVDMGGFRDLSVARAAVKEGPASGF